MSKALELTKLSKKVSLKRYGASWKQKKKFPEAMTHKIFETYSSFHEK